MSIPMTTTQWDAALKNSTKISNCVKDRTFAKNENTQGLHNLHTEEN